MTDPASAQPPAPASKPTVDPQYARRGFGSEALIAYDEPVARPVDPASDAKPPQAWTRPVPVVLDVAYRRKGFRIGKPEDDSPWATVRRIVAVDSAGTTLASFAPEEGWSTIDSRNTFAHDAGHLHFTIYHLRFAAPPALDRALRDLPGRDVHIIAEDADKRVVSVDSVSGYIPIDRTTDHLVRIGTERVRMGQDPVYERTDATDRHWQFRGSITTDQGVGKSWIFDPVDPAKATPKKSIPVSLQAPVPLVLELEAQVSIYGNPALEQGRTVYLIGDYGRLLATIAAADGWYTRTNWTPSGATRSYHREVLRFAIDPAIVAPQRGKDFASVLVVLVDAAGRTVFYDWISLP